MHSYRAFGEAVAVRWDAVVQGRNSWYESSCQSSRESVVDEKCPVRAQVRLFGSLNDGVAKSPITIEFGGLFSIRDVIAELGRLNGHEFLNRVTDINGVLRRDCRVFVNGRAIDDVARPLSAEGTQANIELVLVAAIEGG